MFCVQVPDLGLVVCQRYLKLKRAEVELEEMELPSVRVKERLCHRWSSMNKNFTKLQKYIFTHANQYKVRCHLNSTPNHTSVRWGCSSDGRALA